MHGSLEVSINTPPSYMFSRVFEKNPISKASLGPYSKLCSDAIWAQEILAPLPPSREKGGRQVNQEGLLLPIEKTRDGFHED